RSSCRRRPCRRRVWYAEAIRAARRARSLLAAVAGRRLAVASDAHRAARRTLAEPLAPGAHLAQTLHDLRLAPNVFGVVDVAELELHLQLHQVLLHRRVVGELLFDDLLHFTKRPLDPGDGTSDWEEEKIGEEAHRARLSCADLSG